jgi:hypothetical protein
MKMQTSRKGRLGVLAGSRIWIFFGVLAATLAFSAVSGTRPVHASSCNCLLARAHATTVCGGNEYVLDFQCPVQSQPDDFLVYCYGSGYGVYDCSTGAPS